MFAKYPDLPGFLATACAVIFVVLIATGFILP